MQATQQLRVRTACPTPTGMNVCLAQSCSVNWAHGMHWELSLLTINNHFKDCLFFVLAMYHIPVYTAKRNGVDFNILLLSQSFNFFQNQIATGIWFSISQYIQCLYTLETESFLKSRKQIARIFKWKVTL